MNEIGASYVTFSLVIGALIMVLGALFLLTSLFYFFRAMLEAQEEKLTLLSLLRREFWPRSSLTERGFIYFGKFQRYLLLVMATFVAFIIFRWSQGDFSEFVHF